MHILRAKAATSSKKHTAQPRQRECNLVTMAFELKMRKTTPAIHQCDTGPETNRHPKAFEGPSLFTAIAARVLLIVKQQETPTETSGQGDSTPQTRAEETPAGALEVPFAHKAGHDPRPRPPGHRCFLLAGVVL